MALILIGLILIFFVSRAIQKSAEPLTRFAPIVRTVGIVAIIIGIVTSCVIQVDPGEIGVQSLFGKVLKTPLESGLHFINPLADVTRFDAKTQNYTMSGIHDEGEKSGDDAIRVLTSDGLEVVIDLTVLYRINPTDAPKILGSLGSDYINKVVRPISRTKIRDNAVYYDAVSLYSKRRDEFQQRIFQTIEKDFKIRGLILEQLLVRNISLPNSVKLSIESKINAEQDAQKMEFVLNKEKLEADRKRMEAQGIADYQKIISTGLNDNQLQYEQIKAIKELASSPNSKIVIMGGGKNTPIILGNN